MNWSQVAAASPHIGHKRLHTRRNLVTSGGKSATRGHKLATRCHKLATNWSQLAARGHKLWSQVAANWPQAGHKLCANWPRARHKVATRGHRSSQICQSCRFKKACVLHSGQDPQHAEQVAVGTLAPRQAASAAPGQAGSAAPSHAPSAGRGHAPKANPLGTQTTTATMLAHRQQQHLALITLMVRTGITGKVPDLTKAADIGAFSNAAVALGGLEGQEHVAAILHQVFLPTHITAFVRRVGAATEDLASPEALRAVLSSAADDVKSTAASKAAAEEARLLAPGRLRAWVGLFAFTEGCSGSTCNALQDSWLGHEGWAALQRTGDALRTLRADAAPEMLQRTVDAASSLPGVGPGYMSKHLVRTWMAHLMSVTPGQVASSGGVAATAPGQVASAGTAATAPGQVASARGRAATTTATTKAPQSRGKALKRPAAAQPALHAARAQDFDAWHFYRTCVNY